jgi:hypothetical protein
VQEDLKSEQNFALKKNMRQPYDQNLKPELTYYEEYLKIVKGLEAVRKCNSTDSPIVERAARVMKHNKIHHLPSLNLFIEDMGAKAAEETRE